MAAATEDEGSESFVARFGRVVMRVISGTVDVLCFVAMVASCAFPWRLGAILGESEWSRSNFRERCLTMAGATFFECLAIPCALASPTRWYVLWVQVDWEESQHGHPIDNFNWHPRFRAIRALCQGLTDVFCFGVGAIGLASPFRACHLLRGLASLCATRAGETPRARHAEETLLECRSWALWCGFLGGLDVLLSPLLLFPLASPTRCVPRDPAPGAGARASLALRGSNVRELTSTWRGPVRLGDAPR